MESIFRYWPVFIGALFEGTKLFSLAVVVYLLLKPGKPKDALRDVIMAANRVLLLAGMLSLLYWIDQLFMSWYSGVEYEQYAVIGVGDEPYWFFFLIVANWTILPCLLWIKKLRNLPWVIGCFTIYWMVFSFIMNYYVFRNCHLYIIPRLSFAGLAIYGTTLTLAYLLYVKWKKGKASSI